MKKVWIGIVILFFLAGCSQSNINIPKLEDKQLLVTHVKDSKLVVFDVNEEKAIYNEDIQFAIHSYAQIGAHQYVVAGRFEKGVLLLDLETQTKTRLLKSKSDITDLVYDPVTDYLYISSAANNEIIIFDLHARKIVKTIEVERCPVAIELYEDSLFVLCECNSKVAIYDLATHSLQHSFDVVTYPTDFQMVQNEIWVGGHGAGMHLNEYIHVYDFEGQIKEKIKTGYMPVSLFHDGLDHYMYGVSHGSNELHVINVHNYEVEHEFTIGNNPYFLTGDKEYIYATALDSNSLTILNRTTFEKKQTYEMLAGPYAIIVGGVPYE